MGIYVPDINARPVMVAGAGALAFFFGPGPTIIATGGLLFPAIANDLHWNRTTSSLALMVIIFTAAMLSPVCGILIDRFGARKLYLPGLLFYGAAYFAIPFFVDGHGTVFSGFFILGIFASTQQPMAVHKIVCEWFNERRGLALGLIAAIGAGVSSMVMPVLANYIIVHFGWRYVFWVIGLAILIIALPVTSVFLRPPNSTAPDQKTVGGTPSLEGVSLGEGLRSGAFWRLCLAMMLATALYFGMNLHLFSLLTDRGVSRTVAALAASTVAVGIIAGQLFASIALDRIRTPKVLALTMAMSLVGLIVFQSGTSKTEVFVGVILLGIGMGSEVSVAAYITSRLFGLRALGMLLGVLIACNTIGGGVGPIVLGYIFDLQKSYDLGVVLGEVALVGAILLVISLPRYRFGGTTGSPDKSESEPVGV